jgi:hypothetical protein
MPYTTLHSKTTAVLGFIFFFFLRKKKGGGGGESGVAGATPLPKNGVAGPPHFWPRGGFGHPIRPVWGGRSHPQAFGGGPATPDFPQEKKKKTKWVCAVGGGRTTPKGLGVVVGGEATPGPWGWSGHPQRHKPISFFFFFFFFFFLGEIRGGRTTPKGLGVASTTPYRLYGVAEATPWPKMGWSGHPIFGQGGGSPPPPPFFLKKKKN